jgi:DUF917 family protein
MDTWTIESEEIPALLEGLAILGNGGGGSPAWGRQILLNDLDHNRTWKIVDPETIPDDWTIVSGGILASVTAIEAVKPAEIIKNWEKVFPTMEVIRLTEQWIGKKVNAFVPFEPGGLNSPLAMTVSARSDIVVIDGDGLGRAAPESQMTSFIGHGVSLTPMPLIDRFGNAVIVIKAQEPTFSDELGRWVVSQGSGLSANTLYPMSAKQLRESVIPGTYSRSLKIGKKVLEARKHQENVIPVLVEVLSARELIQAKIERMQEEKRAGFYFTVASLVGMGNHEGKKVRLIIKNEAMLYLEGEEPRAMFPDSIYMLDPETGRGYMSVELKEGMDIAVLASPCHPRMREAIKTPTGQQSLGPSRYGYPDLEYRTVEELLAD